LPPHRGLIYLLFVIMHNSARLTSENDRSYLANIRSVIGRARALKHQKPIEPEYLENAPGPTYAEHRVIPSYPSSPRCGGFGKSWVAECVKRFAEAGLSRLDARQAAEARPAASRRRVAMRRAAGLQPRDRGGYDFISSSMNARSACRRRRSCCA